jgi:hypothetical protein
MGLSAALKNTATRAQHGGFAGRSALSQRLARPTTPLGTENDCPAVGFRRNSRQTACHLGNVCYKIADLLKASGTCAAVWADWWGFKMESYDAITENLAILEREGACGMIHSDDANGIQRLNQEIAKVRAAAKRAGYDIAEERAWTWVAIAPARALGVDAMTGSLRPGKMADIVLWNGNPFSVYTRPEKVWVDGALLYDMHDPTRRPVSDFELGQPGSGDVK